MNLWPKKIDAIGVVNRGDPCESGLCTRCKSDCKGKCETWLACLRGREIIYPKGFGRITAGSANTVFLGTGYHALRIQGYVYGATVQNKDADYCVFPNVSLETTFGRNVKIKNKLPVLTGALGSTRIAQKYWDTFAYAAALCGFPITIGENVVGIDKKAVIENECIQVAPELDRRIESYLKYYNGYGCLFVQMNVEDTRNGVAEYLVKKYADYIDRGVIIIELKWGQGAKCIGGEITVKNIEYAKFLKNDRNYIVDPDPDNQEIEKSFEEGAIKGFTRHSRLGYIDCVEMIDVRKQFMDAVDGLRKLGFNGISLKTGAYDAKTLAMAIRYSSDAGLDLLTIDGSGGGTGQSPWNMMNEWGVPSLNLHQLAYEQCEVLRENGRIAPDLAFAGGLAREDHIFKALALGSPYAKMICMGRSMMIGGYLGNNIAGALDEDNREKFHGEWIELPKNVTEYGKKPRQILSGYEEVKQLVGQADIKNLPLGTVCIYNYVDKLKCGLQQFLAGVRKFNVCEINRDDLMSANKETQELTKIPLMGTNNAYSILVD
jgi:hypothetical protein